MKSPSRKYLALKTLWTREEVCVCRSHPCFAKRARLNAFRSWNPKPPSVLGTQILSQQIQVVLFFPFFCPHQNQRTMLVISSHNAVGSKKTLMVYVGIARVIAFMRISLLAWDNNFSFQPESLLSNLSFRCQNVLHFSCCLMISASKQFFMVS